MHSSATPSVPSGRAGEIRVQPLAAATPGTSGRLGLGRVGARNGLRLAQLGLRAGAEVTVLSRTAGGGRLVGVGTARVGLDRETSRGLELHTTGPDA